MLENALSLNFYQGLMGENLSLSSADGASSPPAITSREKNAYYAGRTLNLPFRLISVTADVALQIIQSISTTFEVLISRLETNDGSESKILKFFWKKFSVSAICGKVRNRLTANSPTLLARSLNLIGDGDVVPSFSSMWRNKLQSWVFIKPLILEKKSN